jgi:plasmid stabilization system protein ParE
LQNAQKVRNNILNSISSLNFMPQKYPKELNLNQNIGEFRFIPIYKYKIIFEIKDETVIVLQLFHTSQNPIKISDF